MPQLQPVPKCPSDGKAEVTDKAVRQQKPARNPLRESLTGNTIAKSQPDQETKVEQRRFRSNIKCTEHRQGELFWFCP